MLRENNRVYTSQLCAMIIIASTTYKVAMLPKYLAITAGRSSFVVIAIMMAIEIVMYGLVYYSITRMNLAREENKGFMIPLMVVIYALAMFKSVIFISETITYISATLFDEGRIAFILLALLPVLGYLALKGGNTIARLTQIVFWIIVVAVGFNILFLRINADFGHLLPMFDGGIKPILEGMNNYYVWFGDYIPLLFLFLVREEKATRKRALFPIVLVAVYVGVIGFYLLFTAAYGGAAQVIDFAFSKLAVFTKISLLLGSTDFPTVITWLLMSIIKLALLLYTASMALNYFVKRKVISVIINMLIVGLMVGLVVTTVERAYYIATSWVKYLVAVGQYATPIIVAIFVRVKYGKTKQA